MWHRCISIVVVVTCFCFIIQAQPDRYQITEKREQKKYCGYILADILATICQGKYNTKSKKSTYDSESDEDYITGQQQGYLDETAYQFPFRSRPNAAALITGTFRRYARGVYDECCKKPCSFNELRSYCAA